MTGPLLAVNPAMLLETDRFVGIYATIEAVIDVLGRRWADFRPADLYPKLGWTVIHGDPITTPDPPVFAVFLTEGEMAEAGGGCGGNFSNELRVTVRAYLKKWEGANKNVVDPDATRVLDALTVLFRKHRFLKDAEGNGRCRRPGALPTGVGLTSELDASRQEQPSFRRYADLFLTIKTLDVVMSAETSP